MNVLKKRSPKEHRMVGKVIGVCMSQRRTDPKKNLGEGLLPKGLGLVGDSLEQPEKNYFLSRLLYSM
jgi:hypothetical protein